MFKQIFTHCFLTVPATLCMLASPASAQSADSAADTAVYPIQFLCGPSVEGFQEGVVRGVHATSILLFNPAPARTVAFSKNVARALPFQTAGTVGDPARDRIGPQQAIGIECDELRMMLPASMTTQFRTGILHVVANGDLVVTVTYSSRPHDGDVSTIDVETVEAQRIKTPPSEPEELPDLVVRSINSINVRCPTGTGSCVTTARISLANIGAGDAGAFTTRVLLDPSQSVAVTLDQPGGLAAGATVKVPLTSPPGGNCFDPNCQICATVDAPPMVIESDETNNMLCVERQE
ncbi:CARDB domain-containing protein [Roseovarius sp. M141]|uniref:CARDB domain-containing protein n=1 Tax=Roseovarius sp. M141 TaxID=2583806 RepID=UPI0020CF3AB5|nr:CARDB domain-containing protein [Roseovarius sp. M141]MCQ0091087.1 hypothetical protein [Roseovarius sp. M141]